MRTRAAQRAGQLALTAALLVMIAAVLRFMYGPPPADDMIQGQPLAKLEANSVPCLRLRIC